LPIEKVCCYDSESESDSESEYEEILLALTGRNDVCKYNGCQADIDIGIGFCPRHENINFQLMEGDYGYIITDDPYDLSIIKYDQLINYIHTKASICENIVKLKVKGEDKNQLLTIALGEHFRLSFDIFNSNYN